jgi:hypothetical protein
VNSELFCFAGDQATLQPPLPLQLFLPLQPMSPVLQPPWPLQLFMPLQSCLLEAVSEALLPAELVLHPVTPTVPASNPVIAAEMINVLTVLVIVLTFLLCCVVVYLIGSHQGPPVT